MSLNCPDAGDDWRAGGFTADGGARLHGMMRGPWAVSADDAPAEGGRLLPVGITHLATGFILADCPHGAAAMRLADALIIAFPGFADVEANRDEIVAQLPKIAELIAAHGCRFMMAK